VGQALTGTKRKPVQVGLVIVFLSLAVYPLIGGAQAQNVTAFTPADKFSIPETNGSVSFAINGSYTNATLQNNQWTFNGLVLNNPQFTGNLTVSARESNITITDYRPSTTAGRSQVLRYIAQGQGTQTVNLHLNTTKSTSATEWMVIVSPATFLAESQGWNLQPDNTVVLNDLVGNVTVFHYVLNLPDDSNTPFILRHSVAITALAVVAATVAAATIIAVKVRR